MHAYDNNLNRLLSLIFYLKIGDIRKYTYKFGLLWDFVFFYVFHELDFLFKDFVFVDFFIFICFRLFSICVCQLRFFPDETYLAFEFSIF